MAETNNNIIISQDGKYYEVTKHFSVEITELYYTTSGNDKLINVTASLRDNEKYKKLVADGQSHLEAIKTLFTLIEAQDSYENAKKND